MKKKTKQNTTHMTVQVIMTSFYLLAQHFLTNYWPTSIFSTALSMFSKALNDKETHQVHRHLSKTFSSSAVSDCIGI